jgi:hypothetical protein
LFRHAKIFFRLRWRSSTAEQLICNQQVVGSSPIASSIQTRLRLDKIESAAVFRRRTLIETVGNLGSGGEVPEWPKGADCKSAGDAFEGSNPSLSTNFYFAGIAQLVEREPSKLGVAGSSPVSRSNLYTVNGIGAGCSDWNGCMP